MWHFRQGKHLSGMVLSIWESGKTRLSCQNLGFPKGEDFWLKSALEGKKSVLLITAYYKEEVGHGVSIC